MHRPRSERRPSLYDRSPRMRLANCMSLGITVTRFAWSAHKFVSSNS
jgi:hypothetical protein